MFNLSRIFGKRSQKYECSVNTCVASTRNPTNPNPRLRWMVGIELKDEHENTIVLNLCPHHVREFFPQTTEDFFKRLERSERLIKDDKPLETEMIQ